MNAKGGIFCLQPTSGELGGNEEDTIFVEVLPDAVDTSADVEMRYAVIPNGPFTLPEGYQFGSMVVYIYYDGRHVTKPLRLHLPHWYGGRNHVQDGLCFAMAPHSLKEGMRGYHFEVIKGGNFLQHRHWGTLDINGHSSFFTEAFEKGASSRYLATQWERRFASETHTKIVITYYIDVWLKVCIKICIVV